MALFDEILRDIKVEMQDEFDKNFSQGGFFGERWQARADGTPSMLQQSRTMRSTNRAQIYGNAVIFINSTPYAGIHNTGGEVTSTPTVSRKMKRFAWAKFYEAGGKGDKAKMWRGLALKPVGSKLAIKITMPKRQFVGDHVHVQQCLQEIIDSNLTANLKKMTDRLNKISNE